MWLLVMASSKSMYRWKTKIEADVKNMYAFENEWVFVWHCIKYKRSVAPTVLCVFSWIVGFLLCLSEHTVGDCGPFFLQIQMKNIKSKGSRQKKKNIYEAAAEVVNSIATWIRRNENRVNPKLRHEKMCIRVHFQCGFSGFFFSSLCTVCVHKYAICKRDVRSNNI